MNNTGRDLQLRDICAQLQTDPAAYAAAEDARYEQAVADTAACLAASHTGWSIVMLAGPSSVGKTTTANKLCERMRDDGTDCHVISLDNFYRGRGIAPRLPNGSFDYESIEALNTEQLMGCMTDILHTGRTRLPEFDFIDGVQRPELTELSLPTGAVVIFEGIHALNPLFAEHFAGEQLQRVFVNTLSRFHDGDNTVLTRRQLRLIRRLLRDEQFRGSPADNTLHMWQQVVRGEERYIFPYCGDVSLTVDTTLGYEPCVMRQRLLTMLQHADRDKLAQYAPLVLPLTGGITRFPEASAELVPESGLLREFLG